MGELVNLEEWKKAKEEEETLEVQKDIELLHEELKVIIGEMDSDMGPYMYHQQWLDQLPTLMSLSHTLDGYVYEYDDGSTDEKG